MTGVSDRGPLARCGRGARVPYSAAALGLFNPFWAGIGYPPSGRVYENLQIPIGHLTNILIMLMPLAARPGQASIVH